MLALVQPCIQGQNAVGHAIFGEFGIFTAVTLIFGRFDCAFLHLDYVYVTQVAF